MSRTRISLDGFWAFFTEEEGIASSSNQEVSSPRPYPQLPAGAPYFIQVPGPWQAHPELRNFSGAGWYRQTFQVPDGWQPGQNPDRVVLGFGAVDQEAEVWVNGQFAGRHTGGYLPFELDITPLVRDAANELVVYVDDCLEDFPEVPHGKQSWYGLLSGIWQPVWLETRPALHLSAVHVRAQAGEQVQVHIRLNAPPTPGLRLHLRATGPNGELAAEADFACEAQEIILSLRVPNPRLWDLDSPNLYCLHTRLEGGAAADEMSQTFGFRSLEVHAGRLLLNGRPIFLRGALDQDYYPELICTPPSVEFIEAQFRQAQALGLNCLRIHIKVADPRYYEVADRLGLLVWTELPNWQILTPAARHRAKETMTGMVQRDGHHPSIVIWTLINESWGVDLTDPEQRAWLVDMYNLFKELDPHRQVVGNSACWGNFQVVTDIEDFHNYYAMPDHYRQWKSWVQNFSGRPDWVYAHEYQDYTRWRRFMRSPWRRVPRLAAPEIRRHGQEPLIVSEFGNWGLPDIDNLRRPHGGGEPWWFENGHEWDEGQVYPHGIEHRFETFFMRRAFPSLQELAHQSQGLQFQAMKYQIEQMRRLESLCGYVITEFTDVHWECNGLLDFYRNPKVYFDQFASINSDDLIIPEWQRLAYWGGERIQVSLSLSHYSSLDLTNSRLTWQVEEEAAIGGERTIRRAPEAAVTRLGQIRFTTPEVTSPRRLRLQFRLHDQQGRLAAENFVELFVFPRLVAESSLCIYAPELTAPLAALGYHIVPELSQANVAIARLLTDDLRAYMLAGGRVLWLAEEDEAQKTYLGSLKLAKRRKTAWQGDWASSLSWIYKDRIFGELPTPGVVDFLFADLTPDHVLTGLPSLDFAHHVHAALTVGWLHKTVALVAERTLGKGRLVASTFQLSRRLASNPVAAYMLAEMLRLLRTKE